MPWKDRRLQDGTRIPGVAFGTIIHGTILKWTAGHDQEVIDQVHQAFDVGFTHLDTAQAYGNEKEVGQAIKDIDRSSLYITTKWSGRKSMNESLHDSLEWLGIDQIDLYLIHAPRIAGDDIAGTWTEFLKLREDGYIKSAGVSNFGISELEAIRESGLEMPQANQIKLEPCLPFADTRALLNYHKDHGVVTEAYSTLYPLTHDVENCDAIKPIESIAHKHKTVPEEVLFAWARQKGAVVVTTSRRRDRLEKYLEAGDLHLSKHEIHTIDKVGGAPPESAVGKAQILAPVTFAVIVLALALLWFWRKQKFGRTPLRAGPRHVGYETISQDDEGGRHA